MNSESAQCTRLSKLRAAFALRLFFMSPIYFFISWSSSSRRAILLPGSLDDLAEWLGCLDDLTERSGCLDDWAILSGFRQLGWVELPALSSLYLLGNGVFCTSLFLRQVTCRLSASWSSDLFFLAGGGWLSSWGVGGPFRIACHNSLFCLVVSRARSWMLVAITYICLSIGVMGGSMLVPSWRWVPSIASADVQGALLFLGTLVPTDGTNWWCQKSVGPFLHLS